MVPHRKILRAIALAAHASLTPESVRDTLCGRFRVRFPRDPIAFVRDELIAYLSPEVEALMTTKDPSKLDYGPELMAAAELELSNLLSVTPTGLTVVVPEFLVKLRKHDTLRVCIETMILCAIPFSTIVDDIRTMYQLTITEDDIAQFADLFMDRDFAEGDSWIEYTQCIGQDETQFKFRLMNAPKDYARWKLGARVQLDSDQVLDRLMSDSYYASQQMKIEIPNPSRDELARIKLERETIFKAMDRRLKIKEVKAASGEKGSETAAALIGKIILKYGDEPDMPLMGDLKNDEKPS